MSRVAVATVWVVLALAAREGFTAPAPADAIRAAWSELDAAWAARDLERMVRLFADEAVFAFPPGDYRLDGKPAIRAHFAAQFPKQSPALRHVTEVGHIRPVGDGLYAGDAGVRVVRTADDGAELSVLRAFAVFALMRAREQGWELLEVRAFRLPDEPEAR